MKLNKIRKQMSQIKSWIKKQNFSSKMNVASNTELGNLISSKEDRFELVFRILDRQFERITRLEGIVGEESRNHH